MTYRNATSSPLAHPKPTRQLSAEYLSWIRSQDCIVRGKDCAGPIDANHLQHVGAGGSDYSALPFCRLHHSQYHEQPLYWFESKYQINVWREAAFALMAWIDLGVKVP